MLGEMLKRGRERRRSTNKNRIDKLKKGCFFSIVLPIFFFLCPVSRQLLTQECVCITTNNDEFDDGPGGEDYVLQRLVKSVAMFT